MAIHGAGSAGTQVNRIFDALGYPDNFGDTIGAMVDLRSGNLQGAVRNLVDLRSGLTTGQMDRMFGRAGTPEFRRCFCPRAHFTGPHLAKYQHTYAVHNRVGKGAYVGKKYQMGGFLGALGIQGRISGKQYRGSFARPIRLGNDGYLFRGRQYKNLGAIRADMRDGRVDGLATRRYTRTGYIRMPFATRLPNMINSLFTPGWRPNIAGAFQQIAGLLGAGGASGAGASGGASGGGGAGAAAGAGSSQSVLSNPNLTIEDKLSLLMAKLSDHLDKQIESKMKEIEKAMQQQEAQKKKKGGGGIFGKIFGGIGKMFGGALGGVGGSLLGGLFGGGGKSGGAGGGDGKKPNLQLLQTQLQQVLQKRQQMFQTMSSILKSLHDTSMNAIRNLKA